MGLARSICEDPEMAAFTKSIQEDLFRIGSSLRTPPESPKPPIVIETNLGRAIDGRGAQDRGHRGMLADWSVTGEHRAAAAYDVAGRFAGGRSGLSSACRRMAPRFSRRCSPT
jgi:cob(I)alamin adenosyltransferase